MDTLNTQIDASSTMGTSETHSEKATASDEEDFKLDIPYYDDENGEGDGGVSGNNSNSPANKIDYLRLQQQQSSISTTSSNYDLMQQNLDDDENNQQNYTNWDNDDLMGSEYSAQSESPNIFLTPGAGYGGSGADAEPPITPAAYYDDPNAPDIKYSPHELLLQPPQRYHSSMQFEMQPPTQHQRRHLQPLPPPPPPPHMQHMHPALQHRHHQQQQQQPLHHAQYGGSAGGGVGMPYPPQYPHPQLQGPHTHSHQHQPHPHAHPQAQPHHASTVFHHHPNMWYPNAPYGASRYNYDGQRYPYQHYNAGAYGHDPMLDMLQLSNSGREARNRAEKNRRDKLNGSIQELSTMVPHVAESPRRVDKTAVLRFAAHGLRLKYVFGENLQQQRNQATDPLMKLLDSFFITLTCHGQIVLISSSIEQHLGHCQADLYGQNILHITHPEDHSMLKQQLIPTDLENLFETNCGAEGGGGGYCGGLNDDDSSEPRLRTQAEEELIDKKLREDKRSFTVRLARAGPRSEPTAYEVVRIDGCFRRSDGAPRGVKNNPFPSSLQLIRRSRGRDDTIPLHTISGNDIVLIGIARIIRPPKAMNCIIEPNNLEYKTRHLIDGRIIDCDQRIGLVAGYMTDEIRNLSPFTFMHQDDVRWVIVALRQMYDCNSSYGESTYRLLSRNGNFIYLQSRGYLEIDKNTNKVHSFICINTLLSDEEGKRRVQEMKRKFSIIINTQIPQSSIDAPASDNPQQLEKAVLRLIQNLQKSTDDDENYEQNGENKRNGGNNGHHNEQKNTSQEQQHQQQHQLTTANNPSSTSSGSGGSSKTPPLALVPPETSSVKSSISKSVSVVNVTAARSFRGNQRLKSPLSTTEDDDEDDDHQQLNHKYHHVGGTSPTNLFPHCTCHGYNGGSEICDYCHRLNYTREQQPQHQQQQEKFAIERSAQKHKISVSHSSDGDNEMTQKRRFKESDYVSAIRTPSPSATETIEPDAKDFIENCRNELVSSDDGSSNEIMEQQRPAEIFLNFNNDFEIEIESRQNNDESTTKIRNNKKIKEQNKSIETNVKES